MEKSPVTLAVALVAFVLAAGVGLSKAAVYTVGDSQGWTIGPNYTTWGSSKAFAAGDILLFQYDKTIHNVVEVSKSNYDSCSAASPIKKYTSGNDSITITSKGHHYFICGFPGHCDAGQKVDISVSKSSSSSPSAAPSSSPSPTPSSSPPSSPASSGGSGGSPAATSPKPSSGTRAAPTVLATALAVFSFAAMSSGLLMQQLL